MKNWSFGKRVGVGFAAVILLSLALGAFSYSRLVSIRTASDHITQQTIPIADLCRRVQMNVKDSVQVCYKHVGSTSSRDMADLEAQLKAGSADNNAAYAALEKLLASGEGHERLLRTEKAREEYNKLRDEVLAVSRQATNNAAAYQLARTQLDPASDRYIGAINGLIELSQNEAAVAAKGIQSAVSSSIWGILLGSLLSVLVGGSVGTLIVIGTSRLLTGVATQLEQSSVQLAAASNQVSAASQSLAEGASEQAASIEETSSSLEEMSSMTQRNAENAQKANELARHARTAADAGASDMQAMNQAMHEIKAASDEIGKIIKTIDEIAFQTNILALNAAVEAARAGEAGMGFAVVADEVRNLAQRCAQSARETADKIEGAITKTSQGVEISAKVTQGLQEIVAKVRQVDELVAEVATASKEQSQGISQVNMAVGQMDKVTQSNAAHAEESASAAEELNAQAESLKEAINELMHLVGRQATVQTEVAAQAKATASVQAARPPQHRNNGNSHMLVLPQPELAPAGAEMAHSRVARPEVAGTSRAARRTEALPLPDDFRDF